MYGAALLFGGFLWANEAKADSKLRHVYMHYDELIITKGNVEFQAYQNAYLERSCTMSFDEIKIYDDNCSGPKKGAITYIVDGEGTDNIDEMDKKDCSNNKKCLKIFKTADKVYKKYWKILKVNKGLKKWDNYDLNQEANFNEDGFYFNRYENGYSPYFEYDAKNKICRLWFDDYTEVYDDKCDGFKSKKKIENVTTYYKFGGNYLSKEEIDSAEKAYIKLWKKMKVGKQIKKWKKGTWKTENAEEGNKIKDSEIKKKKDFLEELLKN